MGRFQRMLAMLRATCGAQHGLACMCGMTCSCRGTQRHEQWQLTGLAGVTQSGRCTCSRLDAEQAPLRSAACMHTTAGRSRWA